MTEDNVSTETDGKSKVGEWIQNLAQKADDILKNRIIAAALMLYQGIMILVNAGHRSDGMARGIAISIALAAGTSLAQVLSGKERKIRAIIPLVLCIVLAGVIYFYPGPMGFALRYLIALSVLTVGITNIAQTFHLTHTERLLQWVKEKEASFLPNREELPVSTQQTVQEEIDKHMQATVSLVKKVGTSSKLDCLLGIVMAVLGVFLLISPTEGNTVLDVNSGITMILVSLADLAVALRLEWNVRKHSKNSELPSN